VIDGSSGAGLLVLGSAYPDDRFATKVPTSATATTVGGIDFGSYNQQRAR
jgi:hypothetical protein